MEGNWPESGINFPSPKTNSFYDRGKYQLKIIIILKGICLGEGKLYQILASSPPLNKII